MAGWHGYLLISELPPGWTQSQRKTAWSAMQRIGKQSDPQPAKINHVRLSLDGMALIVEAEFDEAEIIREAVVHVIANALNVNPVAVNARIAYTVFAEGQSWMESGHECRAYLAANRDNWDPPEEL